MGSGAVFPRQRSGVAEDQREEKEARGSARAGTLARPGSRGQPGGMLRKYYFWRKQSAWARGSQSLDIEARNTPGVTRPLWSRSL